MKIFDYSYFLSYYLLVNNDEIEILYQDESLLVLNKPTGLLTHRSKLSSDRDSVVDQLKRRFETPPSPVHRLDRATSGLLICAFDSVTASALGESFISGDVSKVYEAVVRGYTDQEGFVERPLSKDGEGELQEAYTSYKRIGTCEIDVPNNKYSTSRYSHIEASPRTGRFHQIRRHMAGIGHPIIGDTSHGDLRHNRIIGQHWNNERLLLHCRSLRFPHPHKGKSLSFRTGLPEEMTRITDRFTLD